MRTQVILVAALVAFGGLAGCMGAKDDTTAPTTPTPGTSITPNSTGGTGKINVLAALNASLALDSPEWVTAGTEVPVALTAPSNAKGAITYTWATGALPATTKVTAVPADTGSAKGADYIAPGNSKSIKFTTAGVYRMHCHPHPYMRSNVTVIEGYQGPSIVEVLITDGTDPSQSRYVPENIVIGPNTTVTYKNVGQQPHTATALGAQEPPLKLATLKADKGAVKVDGEGWQRVVAIFKDSDGRIGIVEKPIYVTKELPEFVSQTFEFTFEYGSPAPLAGTPLEAAGDSKPVTLEQPGLVNINYTFADALAAAQNNAQVEVHFTKDGETQDTLTGGPDATNSLSGKAQAGAYTLKVVPKQGAEITGTVVIEVVYELVPPPPAMPPASSGGHDGHGGHAH